MATFLLALSTGTKKNLFLECFKTTHDLYRKSLDLDSLILLLSFEIFFSTFVKLVDFQGFIDSTDNH